MALSLSEDRYRKVVELREQFEANGADASAAFCERILHGLDRAAE